jgi:hypothetical protein
MEAVQDRQQVELVHDKDYEDAVGPYFGKYLGTYFSARGQVRADLFDAVTKVNAYISFPTGLTGATVEDRYVTELYSYADRQGFRDRFRMLYSE